MKSVNRNNYLFAQQAIDFFFSFIGYRYTKCDRADIKISLILCHNKSRSVYFLLCRRISEQ